MTSPRLRLVLCEGFLDRDFWSGWLVHSGCSAATGRHRWSLPGPMPQGELGKGQYGYETPRGDLVVVEPVGGVIPQLLDRLSDRWNDRQTREWDVLVLNSDDDTCLAQAMTGGDRLLPSTVEHTLAGLASDVVPVTGSSDCWRLDDGNRWVIHARWRSADDQLAPGLPAKHTLERLVCASLLSVYPERGAAIERWLDSRPSPPPKRSAKEWSLSQFAGWYAERGAGGFYSSLWGDPTVANALTEELRATGLDRAMALLLAEDPADAA